MARRSAALLSAALAVLAFVLAGSVVPASGAHGGDSVLPQTGEIDPDTVLLDVSLAPDGDARWEIRYRVRLANENETAAFESLAADVDADRSAYADRFESRIAATVAAAENATGREMAVRNVTVRTERQTIPQEYGILVYGFEWTAFATTDGPRLRAGDAIAGLFLDEATTLTVGWPADHRLVGAAPDPDESGEGSVTWRGPQSFTTDQPRVSVTAAPAPTTTGTEPPAAGGSPSGGTTAAIVVAALAVLAAAGWWWYRRRPAGPTGSSPDDGDGEPPEELLSNEERVLRLLRQHGGRMKQQRVVEELGWTDAKTSQVVGQLRESGEVEGFRLGRENVLRLPEEDEEPGP